MHILEAKCVSSLHVSAGSSVVSARGALTHRQKADRHQLVLVIQHLIWSRSSLSSWKILYAARHRLSNIWKCSGINCFTHSCNTQSASIKDIKHDLEMYKSSDNWIVLLIKRDYSESNEVQTWQSNDQMKKPINTLLSVVLSQGGDLTFLITTSVHQTGSANHHPLNQSFQCGTLN